jgi:hypothetical protein
MFDLRPALPDQAPNRRQTANPEGTMKRQDSDLVAWPLEPAAASGAPIVSLIMTLLGTMLVVALVIAQALLTL